MEHIGRYQIVSEIGKGAMGVVYKAMDPTIGRTVAIKTLRLDVLGADADDMLQRFKNEARAAGVMNHPNIITIYDAGEHEGLFYIAMEFIEGSTLHELLKQERNFPVERIVDIARPVCAGLDYAHARGIVHRDIKPANIMITGSTVKIMDFGIAKGGGTGMTSAGQVVGTPNYMSPEQVKGKTLDGRSDLFSLGVVLYEMMTGERPFAGQNVTTIIYKIVNETPPAPCELDGDIHPGLSAVVMKALAKIPEQRYSTGADLVRDLQSYKSLQVETSTRVSSAPIQRPLAVIGEKVAAASASSVATAVKPAVHKPAPLDSTVATLPRIAVKSSSRWPNKTGLMIGAAVLVVVALSTGTYLRSHRAAPATPTAESAPPLSADAPPRGAKLKHPSAHPAVAQPVEAAAASGDLQISSTPFGAAVTIDGKGNPDWVTPFAARKLKPGAHAVNFSLKGYQPDTQQVEVVAGQKVPLYVQLRVAQGTVALNSDPAGAAIYIDGLDTGQVTPARLTVNEGQHRIALRKEGFKPQVTYADVAAGKIVEFAPAMHAASGQQAESSSAEAPQGQGPNPFRKLKRLFGKAPADSGALEIRTRPRGAEIWLGDAQAPAKTPAKLAVVPGTYEVTLRLAGYKPITRTVQIEPGKIMGVEEIFEPQ